MGKKLLITVGFSCNNNCVVCSNRGRDCVDKKTSEIKELLFQNREHYSEVEFTVGEPTIRGDFFSLLKMAKEIGYKRVEISSNLRLFSYEKFAKKAVDLGLGSATTTIFGKEKVHEAVTRAPNSFKQTVSGCRNLKSLGVNISINTVINSINVNSIEETRDVILSLKPLSIMLLDFIPDGLGSENYKMLVVKVKNLSKALDVFFAKGIFPYTTVYDYPFCVIPEWIREDRGINVKNIVDREGEGDISVNNTGYGDMKRTGRTENGYIDYHKKKVECCRSCKYKERCPGFWEDYVAIFGEGDVKDIALKNNCLY